MREPPFFTIVMPVYDGARFLPDALASLAAQEPFDGGYEVLATDDGSTDDSVRLLREAAARGLPLRIMEGARRGNWVASTNKALREARGRYVLFLHQDDRYGPSRLRVLREAVSSHPRSSFFVNDTRFIDPSGRTVGRWTPPIPAGSVDKRVCLPVLMVQNNFSVPGVMFDRELPGRIGFLDEELRYTADWDYWLRAVLACDVVRIPVALSDFRIHGKSQTVAGFARDLASMRLNLETVVERFLGGMTALTGEKEAVGWSRLARYGVEFDLFLAGQGVKGFSLAPFVREMPRCPPLEFLRYVRLSRLFPRALARLRAGL